MQEHINKVVETSRVPAEITVVVDTALGDVAKHQAHFVKCYLELVTGIAKAKAAASFSSEAVEAAPVCMI